MGGRERKRLRRTCHAVLLNGEACHALLDGDLLWLSLFPLFFSVFLFHSSIQCFPFNFTPFLNSFIFVYVSLPSALLFSDPPSVVPSLAPFSHTPCQHSICLSQISLRQEWLGLSVPPLPHHLTKKSLEKCNYVAFEGFLTC